MEKKLTFCERQALIPKEERLLRSAKTLKPFPSSQEEVERIRKQERLSKGKVFDSDLSD